MSQLIITIPDPQTTRVITGYSNFHGYKTEVPDGNGGVQANPETRSEFAKRKLREHIIEAVRQEEGNAAAQTARVTAETAVLTDIILT